MDDLRTFPLKQGDLDWLCSLYAAINLRYLHDNIFTVSAADKIFNKLITKKLPERGWGVGRYVAEGVDPNENIVELFKFSGFSSVEIIDSSFESIALECNRQSGVLIYLEGVKRCRNRFSHYTIATCVTQSGDIELYDSGNFERLSRVDNKLKAGTLNVMVSSAWRIGSPVTPTP